MRVVGYVAVAVVAAAVLAGVAIGVQSIPDIQRYLKMRRM
ncbi:DUF6893 family small protein [Mycolicibacterium vaccae]